MPPIEVRLWSGGATLFGGFVGKAPGGVRGNAPGIFSEFYVNFRPGEHL